MLSFMEKLERLFNLCKYFLRNILSGIRKNKLVILFIIALIGSFIVVSGFKMLMTVLVVLLVYRLLEKIVDIKKEDMMIARFDPRTPELLDNIIKESINEYIIYNLKGDVKNINSKEEGEMNKEVSSIISTRLINSSVYLKLKDYYGDLLYSVIAVQINMHVTKFVIDSNTSNRQDRNIPKLNSVSNNNEVDTTKLLKDAGLM